MLLAQLAPLLGKARIPTSPPNVVVGIPADLIRRRPDLRWAERQIAAQNAQIGVAEADFYPAFFINGAFGFEAKDLSKLFATKNINAQIGPAFQWNILNYGGILTNVRLQDFKTLELVGVYQQKVLAAAQEVEDGIAGFLDSRAQARKLAQTVEQARQAVKIALADFESGAIDFTAVFTAEQFLVQQENAYAQAVGDIALGLITVYRALGGGWELRLAEHATQAGPVPAADGRPAEELLPAPWQAPEGRPGPRG
jgi:outer membrane protein TolC